jgi:hypothetical protein
MASLERQVPDDNLGKPLVVIAIIYRTPINATPALRERIKPEEMAEQAAYARIHQCVLSAGRKARR